MYKVLKNLFVGILVVLLLLFLFSLFTYNNTKHARAMTSRRRRTRKYVSDRWKKSHVRWQVEEEGPENTLVTVGVQLSCCCVVVILLVARYRCGLDVVDLCCCGVVVYIVVICCVESWIYRLHFFRNTFPPVSHLREISWDEYGIRERYGNLFQITVCGGCGFSSLWRFAQEEAAALGSHRAQSPASAWVASPGYTKDH